MKKIILTSILIISLIRIALCQSNFDSEKLDKYFEVLEQHNKFMGSVAVSKNGEIIYSKTIGFANIENNLKANENSKYKIGSITKTFTSVLILKAVEDKKLNLNQTINTWFPSIENANKITIENLLNHRSGINDFTKTKDYFTWNTQTKTEKELKVFFQSKPKGDAEITKMQLNQGGLVDGINKNTFIKTPDARVSDVFKRISGASVQDNKFVVVRGLSDRYNFALINGASLPSTESDRKAFSFDIFPSNMLENLFIMKSATPELPGEFAGGVIDIKTVEPRSEAFQNIQIGVGFNTIATLLGTFAEDQ